jgi:hypothetical protein
MNDPKKTIQLTTSSNSLEVLNKKHYTYQSTFASTRLQLHFGNRMPCLSPIQECNEKMAFSQGSHTSRPQSAHRRNVSAFSTVAELRAEQKFLLSKNKNIRFRVGGNVRSECIMTAITESHNMQRTNVPTEADMKLLGLTLPDVKDSTVSESCEIRDEIPLDGVTWDQRTEISIEMDDELYHEDDLDSVGLPIVVTSAEHDDAGLPYQRTHTNLKQTKKGKIKRAGGKVKKTLKRLGKKALKKIQPLLCKTRTVFKKRKPPELKRAKGLLT